MSFTWRCTPTVDLSGLSEAPSSFGNQGDAESWLGLVWRELADLGVVSVSLYEDQELRYEMSLAED